MCGIKTTAGNWISKEIVGSVLILYKLKSCTFQLYFVILDSILNYS